MCGRQTLAKLVEQGGHQVLQSGHRDDSIRLYDVQTSVPNSLDHIVNVDQMHWLRKVMSVKLHCLFI